MTYAPLLTDAEITKRNADRSRAIEAYIVRNAANWDELRLLDERDDFGGGVGTWTTPAPDRTPVKPDLPLTWLTLLIGIAAVALACYVSSFFPMGLASGATP